MDLWWQKCWWSYCHCRRRHHYGYSSSCQTIAAIVVYVVVGAAAVLAGVPTYWQRKRTTEASTWRRELWGWRQRPTAPEFLAGFALGRDHRAPSGTTGRASRA
jgi:hypothetical protein